MQPMWAGMQPLWTRMEPLWIICSPCWLECSPCHAFHWFDRLRDRTFQPKKIAKAGAVDLRFFKCSSNVMEGWMIQVSELDIACSIVSQYYYCILLVLYHYITGLSYYRVAGCCVYFYYFYCVVSFKYYRIAWSAYYRFVVLVSVSLYYHIVAFLIIVILH